jgi:hypothetical protein
LINEFIDGELEKGKEPLLFSMLSQHEEARDYFKNLSLIKSAVFDSSVEFPDALDSKILIGAGSQIEKRSKWAVNWNYSFLGYAAAIILLFLSIFFFNQSSSYQKDLEAVSARVNEQQQMLQLLFNVLPAAQVNSTLQNEIIIEAQL